MSKSERAMLNLSFFGLIFLFTVIPPVSLSHLGWVDKTFAVLSGAMMIGYGIRYLCLFPKRFKEEAEVEIVDTWKDKK